MNESVNYEGDCRTALATPGLLNYEIGQTGLKLIDIADIVKFGNRVIQPLVTIHPTSLAVNKGGT